MPVEIAIIGRPNVGKSTLFNRLTGRRAALVDATPGLTRDRREGDAEIGRHAVRLIDTAGLEEAEAGSLSARMREQSEAAIAHADAVLFVMDARAGLTPVDERFAAPIRKSGKPVILVANKCEGRASDAGFYDAYALGLGEPVAISAEHGEGIGDLIAAIEAVCDQVAGEGELAPPGTDAASRPLRLAIVGRPNAGKSTLVNALLGEDRMITGPEAGITRDTIAVPLKWNEQDILLHDTAGLRRKSRIHERAEKLSASDAINAIRFAEVVVVLIDAEIPFEKQDLQIADLVVSEGRGLVIAVNKWDLVEEKQSRLAELRREVERLLPQVKGVPLVPVSASRGGGLDKLMQAVFGIYAMWNRRLPTAALNRWLEEALERHTPPAVTGKRIKLRYMTQPNARPPTFVVFCSRPEKLPEAYRRYLINGIRDSFDLPGVPLRLNLRKGKNPYADKEG
ncbi:MAG: ribosome biogenesis GTPase Der [Pseudomonadota bacterium]|nr:ribosome biogenesis GTPase Der [Pseudomonadota bacterium]